MCDVGGNELAVYNDTTVTFWNVYGIDNAGRINYSDACWNFYLKDHLGTPRVVIDGNGDIISAEDLDMWGYRMTERSFQSDTTFYKYTGKERDVTTGYDYFGARYYDSRIGRWGQVDPLIDKYPSVSPYNYTLNNSINYFDPDGLSTYTDRDGNVLAVYDDGDLNVYRLDVDKDYHGPFHGGEIMGETEFWDEFIHPESGEVMGTILFGESWDSIIEAIHSEAMGMNLIEIAENSLPGRKFDIKVGNPMEGRLLEGKYATKRSAGNYLAAYNASRGTLLGLGVSFVTFKKLAGAVHLGKFNKLNAALIVSKGAYFDNPPWYGEIEYAGRRFIQGWKKGKGK